VEENRGALERTLAVLAPLLGTTAAEAPPEVPATGPAAPPPLAGGREARSA
jgi:hypothetical protein